MRQKAFMAGAPPRSLQCSSRPLAGFGGRSGEEKGRERKGEGGEGKGRGGDVKPPNKNYVYGPDTVKLAGSQNSRFWWKRFSFSVSRSFPVQIDTDSKRSSVIDTIFVIDKFRLRVAEWHRKIVVHCPLLIYVFTAGVKEDRRAQWEWTKHSSDRILVQTRASTWRSPTDVLLRQVRRVVDQSVASRSKVTSTDSRNYINWMLFKDIY